MSWKYKDHIAANYGIHDEQLSNIPERVTKMTFEQWKIFYNGDPEHWQILENSNFTSGSHSYRLPVYKINRYKDNQHCKWEYRYVKFLSPEDYRSYNAFIDEMLTNGEDYENLKELEEFAEIIGRISTQRLKEAQERTQKAIDDNTKLMQEIKLRINVKPDLNEKEGIAHELSF